MKISMQQIEKKNNERNRNLRKQKLEITNKTNETQYKHKTKIITKQNKT